MNNSFARLIDGMNATLRKEVLSRLDDEFARGQVFGVINLLNTFKARADWSAGFLLQQIEAQQVALHAVTELLQDHANAATLATLPGGLHAEAPQTVPISHLLATRDAGNRAIGELLAWLDARSETLAPQAAAQIEALLRTAMRAELSIELKNSPRPLFAEMSSGSEGP